MSYTNAKEEFLEHMQYINSKVKAVIIYYRHSCYWDEDAEAFATLKIGYSEHDFTDFLEEMNFKYDSGYGGQKMFGTIWYEDGTWSSRGEYDGSEGWEYNQVPDIPIDLI